MGFPLINHPFGVPLFVETPKWLLWRHSWGFRVSASGTPLGQRAWLNVGGSRSTEIWTPWKPGAWRRARHPGEKGILIFADISRDSPWLSFHFQLQGWAIQGLQESQETKTNAFSWRFPILFGKSRLPCSWTFLNMIHLAILLRFLPQECRSTEFSDLLGLQDSVHNFGFKRRSECYLWAVDKSDKDPMLDQTTRDIQIRSK